MFNHVSRTLEYNGFEKIIEKYFESYVFGLTKDSQESLKKTFSYIWAIFGKISFCAKKLKMILRGDFFFLKQVICFGAIFCY